jgi:transposase InsO family protein
MDDALDGYENDSDQKAASAAPAVPELSQLMVHLLKGVLYRDDDERLWESLMRLQARVHEQAAVLLLDLVLDEAEGYAFLKSRPDADEAERAPRLPRLIARRPLSYPVSLMLALLRKRLAEFDAGGGETRLVLSRDDIAELMRVFLPDGPNEVRLIDQVDATIAKVVDLGFLRRLKPAVGSAQDRGHFEVRRILKAFVDAQWLADFDARLEVYRTAASDGVDKEASDA